MNTLSPELIRLLIILAATLAAHFIANRLLRHAERVAERTDNVLDDSLLAAGRRPLMAIIWISGNAPDNARAYAAKTRYRQHDAACRISTAGDATQFIFDEAQWAVTPGQSAVLYDGAVCLGGGIINH